MKVENKSDKKSKMVKGLRFDPMGMQSTNSAKDEHNFQPKLRSKKRGTSSDVKQPPVVGDVVSADDSENCDCDHMMLDNEVEATQSDIKIESFEGTVREQADGRPSRDDESVDSTKSVKDLLHLTHTFTNRNKPNSRLKISSMALERLTRGEEIQLCHPFSCALLTVRTVNVKTSILKETPYDSCSRKASVSRSVLQSKPQGAGELCEGQKCSECADDIVEMDCARVSESPVSNLQDSSEESSSTQEPMSSFFRFNSSAKRRKVCQPKLFTKHRNFSSVLFKQRINRPSSSNRHPRRFSAKDELCMSSNKVPGRLSIIGMKRKMEWDLVSQDQPGTKRLALRNSSCSSIMYCDVLTYGFHKSAKILAQTPILSNS